MKLFYTGCIVLRVYTLVANDGDSQYVHVRRISAISLSGDSLSTYSAENHHKM